MLPRRDLGWDVRLRDGSVEMHVRGMKDGFYMRRSCLEKALDAKEHKTPCVELVTITGSSVFVDGEDIIALFDQTPEIVKAFWDDVMADAEYEMTHGGGAGG